MMPRFDGNKRQRGPRNYFARPEQFRLLVLVVSLALVWFVMRQANSPAGRQALARLLGESTSESSFSVAESNHASLDETRQWMTPAQLATIRDNTIFRSVEADAWFATLEQLEQSTEPFDSLPAVDVSYAQFVSQPDAYRGRTVRVVGEIKRVEPQQPAENDMGLAEYYRAIFRPIGKEVWPVAVYSIEAPKGLAKNEPVSAPAVAIGVFFKNQSYQSEAGAGVMPIVLAKSVAVDVPRSKVAVVAAPDKPGDLLAIFVVAAAIATFATLFIAMRGKGS